MHLLLNTDKRTNVNRKGPKAELRMSSFYAYENYHFCYFLPYLDTQQPSLDLLDFGPDVEFDGVLLSG